MRDSSTCNLVCLSPGQTYKLPHGCSRHGIPVMRLPEACHVVDFWYFLLSLSIIRTAPPTIPRVIQAWHIYHKTARSVQSGKLLLKEIGLPDAIVSDMAKEQLSQEVKHFCNLIGTTLQALEEGTPWSN